MICVGLQVCADRNLLIVSNSATMLLHFVSAVSFAAFDHKPSVFHSDWRKYMYVRFWELLSLLKSHEKPFWSSTWSNRGLIAIGIVVTSLTVRLIDKTSSFGSHTRLDRPSMSHLFIDFYRLSASLKWTNYRLVVVCIFSVLCVMLCSMYCVVHVHSEP